MDQATWIDAKFVPPQSVFNCSFQDHDENECKQQARQKYELKTDGKIHSHPVFRIILEYPGHLHRSSAWSQPMSGMYDKGPVLGAAPPSVHRSNIKPGWCEHVPKDYDWLEIAFRCRMFNWLYELYAMMIRYLFYRYVGVLRFSLCSIKQGLPSLRFEICPSLNIHI